MPTPTSDDTSTDPANAPISRRGWGKHLFLSASALAVLFASNQTETVEAAPATDTWKLGGNAGVDSTNFIGPTNSAPLIFKTAGAERLRVTATGNIGIGNESPSARFMVDVTNGVAIYARHLATSGDAPALRGDTAATVDNASAVYGIVTSTAAGVNAAGVRGENSTKNGNGAGVRGNHASNGYGVHGASFSGSGVRGVGTLGVYGTGTTHGLYGDSVDGLGVYGTGATGVSAYGRTNGVEATGVSYGVKATASSGIGVKGDGTTYGLLGSASNGTGVRGSGTTYGVYGSGSTGLYGSGSTYGVEGVSNSFGVKGTGATGVFGDAGTTGNGVSGVGKNGVVGGGSQYGISGSAGTTGTGVYGKGKYGVWGDAASPADFSAVVGNGGQHAVLGQNGRTSGVLGKSNNAGVQGEGAVYGVLGITTGTGATGNFGVYGIAGGAEWGGYFEGSVYATQSFLSGNSSIKIDHPSDPTNRNLSHAHVESPDMKTIYDGVVVLDANGAGVVTMPAWFEALNMEFRYQLTCIGGFAPVYIASKIRDNTFKIAGGTAGMEVSWQVTGIRQDAFARANRLPVESDKSGKERGRYLHPEAFGKPASMSVAALTSPQTSEAATQPQHDEPEAVRP